MQAVSKWNLKLTVQWQVRPYDSNTYKHVKTMFGDTVEEWRNRFIFFLPI